MKRTLLAACCVALGVAAATCDVEQRLGCESNADCRFGRVCLEQTCVWPSAAGAGGTGGGSAGLDAGVGDAGGAAPDRGSDVPSNTRPDSGRPDQGSQDEPPVRPGGDVPGEVIGCLEVSLPTNLTLDAGASLPLEVRVTNCGNDSVEVMSYRIEERGAGILEVMSLGDDLPGRLAPGESFSLIFLVTALRAGASSAVVSVEYALGDGRLSMASGVVEVEVLPEDVDDCGPSVWAQADRDGPGTSDFMVVEVGHQIELYPIADAGLLGELHLLAAPPDSLELVARIDERSGVFVPDAIGEYLLLVETSFAGECFSSHELSFRVELPDADFVAWAVWPEPFPERSVNDLDFYVARLTDRGYLWQTEGLVAGPTSTQANFGDPASRADDAFLNQDYNVQGFGPERITIAEPATNERLAIGVHVFSLAGRQPASPRIRIYLAGSRVFDRQIRLEEGQFWLAAETVGTELVGEYDIVTEGFPPPDEP